jgi:uncharacterized protein (TIGR03435 family)
MLQHLLSSRFGLVAHTETRYMASYIMAADSHLNIQYPEQIDPPSMRVVRVSQTQMESQLRSVTTECYATIYHCLSKSRLLTKPELQNLLMQNS